MPEAAVAAPTPAAPPPSVHERLKSFLSSPPEVSDTAPPSQSTESQATDPKATSGIAPKIAPAERAAPNEQVEGDDAPSETDPEPAAVDDDSSDDAQTEVTQLSTLSELADATGYELDKMLDLALPVKIDGKEGTARLRDLVKSYQLDGHINQKLASLDTDRKTFESKRGESERAVAERLLKLDAGSMTLERALKAEFAAVDWQRLQTEDPMQFNSQWVAYQQRYQVLDDISKQIANERAQFQTQQTEQQKAWLAEQRNLLFAKVPEWSEDKRRNQDKAEIVEYLKDYGITKEEFEQIGDHRQLLVVRDALKWRQLQKSRPLALNKVKAAPKLLKPGTPQSRAVVEGLASKRERETLKQSGKVSDAKAPLKRLLFGGR